MIFYVSSTRILLTGIIFFYNNQTSTMFYAGAREVAGEGIIRKVCPPHPFPLPQGERELVFVFYLVPQIDLGFLPQVGRNEGAVPLEG